MVRSLTRGAAAVLALAMAAPVPTALAHEGNPNFRSTIRGVQPAVAGLSAEVLNFDDRLELVNRSGRTVVVVGYEDEPYARLRADGAVEVNRSSTAAYLNDDRFADARVPADAGKDAPVVWRRENGTGRLEWHDHRAHWMSRGLPPQVSDEGRRTKVFDYRIPLLVDGRRVALNGTLTWVGEQDEDTPIAPFVALGVVALVSVGVVVVLRRRRRTGPDPSEAW